MVLCTLLDIAFAVAGGRSGRVLLSSQSSSLFVGTLLLDHKLLFDLRVMRLQPCLESRVVGLNSCLGRRVVGVQGLLQVA